MIAYSCDICKRFYVRDLTDPDGRINPFTNEPIPFYRDKLAVMSGTGDLKSIDVCPICMKKIQNVAEDLRKNGGN